MNKVMLIGNVGVDPDVRYVDVATESSGTRLQDSHMKRLLHEEAESSTPQIFCMRLQKKNSTNRLWSGCMKSWPWVPEL